MTEPRVTRCEEALRRLADFLSGELTTDEHAEVEHHMERCRACFSRSEFERRLKEKLAATGREPPPRSMGDRIRKILGEY
jgi:anti-sigma factor (TIGR02949 family)